MAAMPGDRHGQEPDLDDLSRAVDRREWTDGVESRGTDRVAAEEPLEIRVSGVPIAVVMRTPGHDIDLVRGFLLTERIVDTATDIASIRHCTTVDTPEAEDNVVQVTLAPQVQVDIASLRRNLFTTSSCGVCGKASIDQAMAIAEPLTNAATVTPERLYALPDLLRAEQPTFAKTGGLHAAALFGRSGALLAAREDVGRHNAVDKVIGRVAVAAPRGSEPLILMVSGRVSFEITQKSLAARIPILAAVSAPSSLAVELAQQSGLTLIAFLRGRRMCVYAGPERIRS